MSYKKTRTRRLRTWRHDCERSQLIGSKILGTCSVVPLNYDKMEDRSAIVNVSWAGVDRLLNGVINIRYYRAQDGKGFSKTRHRLALNLHSEFELKVRTRGWMERFPGISIIKRTAIWALELRVKRIEKLSTYGLDFSVFTGNRCFHGSHTHVQRYATHKRIRHYFGLYSP